MRRHDYIEIRALCAGSEVGRTDRHVCPVCGGGTRREESLAITHNDNGTSAFICHRASCGIRGRVRTGNLSSYGASEHKSVRKKAPRLLSVEFRKLALFELSILYEMYAILRSTADREGWCAVAESSDAVLPIRGPTGDLRGYQVRPLTDGGFGKPPRTYAASAEAEPFYFHWSRPLDSVSDRRPTVALVEDQVSSAKVAQAGFLCGALIGTDLSYAKLAEACYQVPEEGKLLLCLDADASGKALEYVRRLRTVAASLGATLEARILKQDLKYESCDSIRELLAGRG